MGSQQNPQLQIPRLLVPEQTATIPAQKMHEQLSICRFPYTRDVL